MSIFKKNEKESIQELQNVQRVNDNEDPKSVELLAKNVMDNKKRIEEQKKNIHLKINELNKKLGEPTHIRKEKLTSFALEDIENSTEPMESRSDIARKIVALMNAENMCIYNDSQFMDSIKEYLKAIKPEVERIDDEQWKLIAALNEAKYNYYRTVSGLQTSYNLLDNDMTKLLKVANISYPRVDYNKKNTQGNCWCDQIGNVADLINLLINTDDGETFNTRRG